MTRSVWWNPDELWFSPNRHYSRQEYHFDMTDDGWTLYLQWWRADIGDDHDVSGVLADWWEEHMPPTPESVRFVAKLREWFHSREGVGT